MRSIIRRLAVVGSAAAAALAMSASGAGASSQHASQTGAVGQEAKSFAGSLQVLPVNANVPVQFLSVGKNGGDNNQSNNSTAKSKAINDAYFSQKSFGDQHSKAHDGYDRTGRESSSAGQEAFVGQKAKSFAGSLQVLPVNANVPVQFLSVGKNGGNNDQSNNSTAKSSASNDASIWQKSSGNQHDNSWDSGRGNTGFDGKNRDGSSNGQDAAIGQNAKSFAGSAQLVPVNVNAPVQVLSVGTNGGDNNQSNNSTAKSSASNDASIWQKSSGNQHDNSWDSGRGNKGFDGKNRDGSSSGGQDAFVGQTAKSFAGSAQLAPVNVNAPIQVLSVGHNGGNNDQSNNSTAKSSASNDAGTGQVLGLLG